MVWGGLWGLLFVAPTPPRWTLPFRGLVFSAGPDALALFDLFAFRPEGTGLGFVLAAAALALAGNALWGLIAGWGLELCGYLELMRDRLRVKAVKI